MASEVSKAFTAKADLKATKRSLRRINRAKRKQVWVELSGTHYDIVADDRLGDMIPEDEAITSIYAETSTTGEPEFYINVQGNGRSFSKTIDKLNAQMLYDRDLELTVEHKGTYLVAA